MRDQVETIYQTIQFIERHLGEEITVGQMAEAAGYSVFHFIRTFNQVVHHTPCDYLMRRRLTEAARQLIDSNWRIIDIAQDFCFNSQEGFARVFKKMFHLTPGQVRKNKKIPVYAQMPVKTMKDLYFVNGGRFHSPLLEEKEGISLKGLMTALDADDGVQPSQCGRLQKDMLALLKTTSDSGFYQVFSSADPYWDNRYYFVGVEDYDLKTESANLVSRTIPAGLFVRINAAEKDRVSALRYVYSTWMPKAGLIVSGNMEMINPHGEAGFVSILIPVTRIVD